MSKPIYLRRGENEGDAAVAYFNFEGTTVALLVDAELHVQVRSVKKDGSLGAKTHGEGGLELVVPEDEKQPTMRGYFTTTKGSHFTIAGWHHERNDDEFVALRINPRVVRSGFFPSRSNT